MESAGRCMDGRFSGKSRARHREIARDQARPGRPSAVAPPRRRRMSPDRGAVRRAGRAWRAVAASRRNRGEASAPAIGETGWQARSAVASIPGGDPDCRNPG